MLDTMMSILQRWQPKGVHKAKFDDENEVECENEHYQFSGGPYVLDVE